MACAFAPQNSGTPKISEKNTAQELSGYHPAVRDVTANPENEKTDDVTLKTALSIIPSPDLYCLAPDYNPRNIQKIVEEGILLAGGAVAILLQVADPGVERAIIIEMVNRAHVPVKGKDYTADDPALQLWVAATLYVAGVDIYEKIFGKLDDVAAEEVFKEYAVLATSLRVPPEMWPKSRAEFWKYWDERIETLVITDHAKAVAKDLLYNKNGPVWIRSQLPLVRLLTAEWLPARMREAYGLKTTKTRRVLYRAGMGYVKVVYPFVPAFIRHAPLHYYMRDMRKRMAKLGEV